MRFLALLGGLTVALALLPRGQEDIVHNPNSATFLHNRTGFLTGENKGKPEAIARGYIAKILGADGEWVLRSSYGTKHNGVHHLAFRRHFSGMECANCDLTVNIDRFGRVINMGYQHVPEEALTVLAAKNQVTLVTAMEAVQAFVEHAKIMTQDDLTKGAFLTSDEDGFKHTFSFPALAEAVKTDGAVTATLQYFYDSVKNEVASAWKVELQTEAPHTAWFEAWMHAETKERVAVLDLVDWDGPASYAPEAAAVPRHGTYEVYSIPDTDPILGDRTIERDAEDAEASPLFWNRQNDQRVFQDTIGNNVYAQENWAGGSSWQNNYRPSGGTELNFQFPIDFSRQPEDYADAAIANLFYWNNIIHDIFQLHGFDEASGNFQENNMGRGGRENDAVQANAQDGAGYNNANFATPVDGQRPRMRMYLWNGVNPMRDGDLDSGIIVHEYGHGISQRLTGGPMNVGCLRGGQSGGMGEGWGDWWATIFSMRREYVRNDAFPMGLYAAQRGIRPFPYSGSITVNPQTYGYLTRSGYSGVHAIGSVWAQILFSVYWEMVDEFGFNPDWYRGEAGNNILFQNVVDGLKLQPCNPTFIQARNAMMQADQANYGGRHQCTMWTAFAQRGLGFSAATGPVREAFDMPPECA